MLTLELPRRRPADHLFGPELDHRLPDVLVLVNDVHVTCPGRVRRPCHRARELRVLRKRLNLEGLTGFECEAHLDDEARVGVKTLVAAHGAGCYPRRLMIAVVAAKPTREGS